MLNLIINIVAFLAVVRFAYQFRGKFDFLVDVWKMFSWKMLAQVLPAIVATIILIQLLETRVHFMDVSWTRYVFGYSLNMTLGLAAWFSTLHNPVLRHLLPMAFCLLMIGVLPLLAAIEEVVFRKEKLRAAQIIRSSIVFGLVHTLCGVTLGMGIGLILPGLFYAYQYRKAYFKAYAKLAAYDQRPASELETACHDEATMTSTAYHTMWNTIVFIYAGVHYSL